jgi:hypothetical protein
MRFRPGLATSCSKSVPITTPRFGEGGGLDSRICASQALAALVSSCHASHACYSSDPVSVTRHRRIRTHFQRPIVHICCL